MNFNKLEKFILEIMSRYRMAGLSIGILSDNQVIYAKGFGYKDIEASVPSTPQTNYGVGSITKIFTAIGILQLYERKLIDLYDPVNKYISVIKNHDITIHHLLTHTSGIPPLGYLGVLVDSFYGNNAVWLPTSTEDSILAFMDDYDKWVTFKPGERWFYSNEGYVLLGKIIEKVSNMKYQDYIKQNILARIGASKSYFYREEYINDPDKAVPYIVDQNGRFIRKEAIFSFSSEAGLYSNVIDLLKLSNILINRGSYENTHLLDQKLVENMEKPYAKLPYDSSNNWWYAQYYGYGVIINDNFHGRKLVGHTGFIKAYTGYLGYIPMERISVALLTNSAGYPPALIGAYALTLLLGLDPDENLSFIKYERMLDKIEGTYYGYMRTLQYRVKRAGYALMIEDLINKTQTIAFPQKMTEDNALFYTMSVEAKMPIEFIFEKDRLIMIYDRYVAIKE